MTALRKIVRNEFDKLGVPNGYSGEDFLTFAIKLLQEQPLRLCCVSKMLYIDIADFYHTNPVCVERNLRTFINVVWEKGDRKGLERMAGRELKKRPSNIDFIDMVKLYLNENQLIG